VLVLMLLAAVSAQSITLWTLFGSGDGSGCSASPKPPGCPSDNNLKSSNTLSNPWYSQPIGTANNFGDGTLKTAYPKLAPEQLLCSIQQQIVGSTVNAISAPSSTSASPTSFNTTDKNYNVMGEYVNNAGCVDTWILNQGSVLGPHTVIEGPCRYAVWLIPSNLAVTPAPTTAFAAQVWVQLTCANTNGANAKCVTKQNMDKLAPTDGPFTKSFMTSGSSFGNYTFGPGTSGYVPLWPALSGRPYNVYYYGCTPYFNIVVNLATFIACILISIGFLFYMRGEYPKLIAMEREMNFQGFEEAPIKAKDGCCAKEEEKHGFKGTDEEFDKLFAETTQLTFHKWLRLQFFFHPMLAVFYAPRRDTYTPTRRGLVMMISFGCGLITTGMLFPMLANGMDPVSGAIISNVISMFVGLFMEKPMTFLIKCSAGLGDGCWGSCVRCIVNPCIVILAFIPIGALIALGISMSAVGTFAPSVLGWAASIFTGFVVAIIVPTVMWVLPKFGNAADSIKAINEVYRSKEISENRDNIPEIAEMGGLTKRKATKEEVKRLSVTDPSKLIPCVPKPAAAVEMEQVKTQA